jgi:integrase
MVTYRIDKNLYVLESQNESSWKPSEKEFSHAIKIATIFKDNENFSLLVDGKNPRFLKGKFKNGPVGGKLTVLPDGTKITKSYSLFSPKLHVHDESSHGHWDIIFQNPNGKFAYIYSEEKEAMSKQEKYKKVEIFDSILPKLRRTLNSNISKERILLPIFLLLETKMRIGSEQYYKKNGHRGLTTLKKKDISIKNNKATFEFPSKDGVPQKITKTLPKEVIVLLKKLLNKKKKEDFIFTNKKGHIFKDTDFMKAFKKYSGTEFYPHIVRSHYATKEAENFLKTNKKPTKEQTKKFCKFIAGELGHKKYSKKKDRWQESHEVTLHYYVRPDLSEKIIKFLK